MVPAASTRAPRATGFVWWREACSHSKAVRKPLFERSNRMRGLTAAGRALVPEARALLGRAEGLRELARRAELGEQGCLRVGLIPPAATGRMADHFQAFSRAVPGITISVRMGNQDALMALLVAGELDLVVGRPETPPADSAIKERRLAFEEQGNLLGADEPGAGHSRRFGGPSPASSSSPTRTPCHLEPGRLLPGCQPMDRAARKSVKDLSGRTGRPVFANHDGPRNPARFSVWKIRIPGCQDALFNTMRKPRSCMAASGGRDMRQALRSAWFPSRHPPPRRTRRGASSGPTGSVTGPCE